MSRVSDQHEYMDLDDFEELLADKPRDEKWELIAGRVVRMMVGARWEHKFIIQNLASGLQGRLRAAGSPCRTLVESFRLKSRLLETSVLPDVIVRCGALEPGATSLDDPTVLIEVMSDASVGRGRVEKWRVYQKIAVLQHYVLVERDKPVIEVFDRQQDAGFAQRVLDGLSSILELPAIGTSMPLLEIYQDVLTA